MAKQDNLVSLAIFEDHSIRQIWYEEQWYFSVFDVVKALTGSASPSAYWRKLKQRLNEEGVNAELLMNCVSLKLIALDGKLRETDCADLGVLLKIISLVPALHRRDNRNIDSPEKSGVYAILNTITNEQYIGSSRDMPRRFIHHRSELRRGKHHSSILQAAWDQYGEDAFIFVLLESVPDESDLAAIEQGYIDIENPIYNVDTTAKNAARDIIEEIQIQRLIAFLHERTNLAAKSVYLTAIQKLIERRIVMPGPNFHRLTEAEIAGITNWEALNTFLA